MPGLQLHIAAGIIAAAIAASAAAPAQTQQEYDAALQLYSYRLLQAGSRLRDYPPQALEQRLEGTAFVELVIAADGSVRQATLLTSSGHALLDEHALALLARAVPLTEIPSTLQNRAFAVRISVAFRLPD